MEAVGRMGRDVTIKNRIRSLILNALLSRRFRHAKRGIGEWRRKLTGRRHVVSVFLQLDDPYSYLLSQYLPQLQERYDVDLRVYLAESMGGGYMPKPDMLHAYAETDCARVANELGMHFLDKGPAPAADQKHALLDSLADDAGQPEFVTVVLQALAAYWRGDAESITNIIGSRASGNGRQLVESGQQRLQRSGHYNAATLHYGGEWYWGIDRLHYLTARLDNLGANRGDGPHPDLAANERAMQVVLPITPPEAARNLPALEYFHSFRSPYSWLGLRQAMHVADAFGLELRIRPVLPMVMRGMQVPRNKLVYIVKDTKRESERLQVPFGRLADPVGDGVERLLAVYNYACSENKGREFLLNAGEAIWSQAIDVASDAGMRKVAGNTALFWPEVVDAMRDDSWREVVEQNRESMMASGSWGVPTMRLGDFVVWGQDRIWLLARHIEDLCNTGDGILR
jgi:2-hydroxychromene-2-carboxylate isomerase